MNPDLKKQLEEEQKRFDEDRAEHFAPTEDPEDIYVDEDGNLHI